MVFQLSEQVTRGWKAPMKELPGMVSLSHIPTAEGIHHTAFYVVNAGEDNGKGYVEPLPSSNFHLLSLELQQQIRESFETYGFTFTDDE